MSEDTLILGGEFPASQHEQWMELVNKVLKGADFKKTLVSETYDGLEIQPLYSDVPAHPAAPGAFPFTRAVSANGNSQNGWAITQIYRHPDPAHDNALILDDLARGVTHLRLVMSDAARQGKLQLDDSPANGDGIECYSLADLDSLLENVRLDLAPVELQAGAAFFEYACALMALWDKRALNAADVSGSFSADPATALAEFGELPASSAQMLERLATLAKYTAANYPDVRAVGVASAVYHNAGASHATEIGTALATGVTYLRAMSDAGMAINDACGQLRFTLTTDTDYFQSISKLRVMRELWAEVCKLCGADEAAGAIDLHAVTSARMLSQRDPWVNMLRGTIASCAAAIGGAASVTTQSYDAGLGHPSTLGRRISRNTQLLLQNESYIHRIVDPAGGAFFIENHGEALAEKAWQAFQSIEAQGGIFKALENGSLQSSIAQTRRQRMHDIAFRRKPLTGVSEFANLEENTITTDKVDAEGARRAALDRQATALANPPTIDKTDIDDLKQALQNNATTLQVGKALSGQPSHAEALLPQRLGSEFEALRDASDRFLAKHGKRP
ncbi:MAG: methylmalonyl-CoA mutase subunit beta, partial [Gammaproteobacteria bacterium]|nr:methylmalonyl-CoA mutase subunit beta [Gammaproteobacteria bacterium]